jgi:hypothetical protein
MLRRNVSGTLATLLLSAVAVVACSGEGGRAPASKQTAADEGLGGGATAGEPEYYDDEVEPCTVYVKQGNGVTSCWDGTRTCTGERWTACAVPL